MRSVSGPAELRNFYIPGFTFAPARCTFASNEYLMKPLNIYFLVNMQTAFEQRILRGMARVARAQQPRWRVRWETRLDEGVTAENDGVVIFAVDPSRLQAVRECGLPVVATSTRHLGDGFPCVVTDDEGIGQFAAKHFREKFYRSFAYFGPIDLGFGKARLAAFSRAVAPDPVRVLEYYPGLSPEERLIRLKRDFERLPPHTAIFTGNDVFARMVLMVLQNSRRKVPGDLAVMGVDADDLISLSCPMDLTSVDSAPEAIGAQALALLGRMIDSPGSIPNDTVVRVPPASIIEGASTNALATEDDLVRRARELIQLHACDRDYSIDDLAREAGCSRRSLEYRFAEVTGGGIGQQIWKFRMDRARELLRTTGMTLADVADTCGYVSASHLSVLFKKEMGLTPGQYRKKG